MGRQRKEVCPGCLKEMRVDSLKRHKCRPERKTACEIPNCKHPTTIGHLRRHNRLYHPILAQYTPTMLDYIQSFRGIEPSRCQLMHHIKKHMDHFDVYPQIKGESRKDRMIRLQDIWEREWVMEIEYLLLKGEIKETMKHKLIKEEIARLERKRKREEKRKELSSIGWKIVRKLRSEYPKRYWKQIHVTLTPYMVVTHHPDVEAQEDSDFSRTN